MKEMDYKNRLANRTYIADTLLCTWLKSLTYDSGYGNLMIGNSHTMIPPPTTYIGCSAPKNKQNTTLLLINAHDTMYDEIFLPLLIDMICSLSY